MSSSFLIIFAICAIAIAISYLFRLFLDSVSLNIMIENKKHQQRIYEEQLGAIKAVANSSPAKEVSELPAEVLRLSNYCSQLAHKAGYEILLREIEDGLSAIFLITQRQLQVITELIRFNPNDMDFSACREAAELKFRSTIAELEKKKNESN